MVTLQMIQEAQESLKGIARKTPLENANRLGENIYIKSENLQLTGAFKIRGAYNKIRSLTPEEASHGVIACSAGNHAQGIALSATKLGIKSVICMPEGAPISKVEATRNYGAEVVLVPGVYDDAAREAERLSKEHGYTFAHPFNDPYVIAGQGTIGLEILEQLHFGELLQVTTVPDAATLADGIHVLTPGSLTFEMCQKYVDEIVTVSEDEIAAAILALLEVQKTVAEGAGATPVAACMSGKVDTTKKTVCVVSGGNVDVTTLSRVITRGLTYGGRLATITTKLADRAGSLANLLNVVGGTGANVVRIHHEREDVNSEVNACVVSMVLETRNADHVQKIKDELTAKGYSLLDA